MKKPFIVILVLVALFAGVACLDLTPYPIVDTGADAEPIEVDAGAEGG